MISAHQLTINPCYREYFADLGLTAPATLLALPAVIISGHPDRNVARVRLGTGARSIAAFLKREHRVPWKERVVNAWHGFGFVSKSRRETMTLQTLKAAGISCPEWLAEGEDDAGQAFLLLREFEYSTDLRHYLRDLSQAPRRERHRFAQALGKSIAQLHNGGFQHGDLYSKHVYVDPRNASIHLIDWQRARRRNFISWRLRCRDLAALAATVDESLAGPREQQACFVAYLKKCKSLLRRRNSSKAMAKCIIKRKRALLANGKVREIKRVPPEAQGQNVIWRDGEELCVTEEFNDAVSDMYPDWLDYGKMLRRGRNLKTETRCPAGFPLARLTFRRETRIFAWFATWLRGKKLVSTSVRQAGALLKRQRQGVKAPRLLAFGQRQPAPWCVESFILVEDDGSEVIDEAHEYRAVL
jgi:tRNA A-37 threonylcarbamoyl transferase component Bud32